MNGLIDAPPSPAGLFLHRLTGRRQAVVGLVSDAIERPELLDAYASAARGVPGLELVLYAPDADAQAIGPAVEAAVRSAGLDGHEHDVALLCVPAAEGDAAVASAAGAILGACPPRPAFDGLLRLDLDRAGRLRPVVELDRLWIGDSHSTFFAGTPLRQATPADRGEAAAWLGPRLMYSIARKGFPTPLTAELSDAAFDVGAIAVTTGEIDCRVHLGERVAAGDTLPFVGDYVRQVVELKRTLGAPRAFLIGPVPPSDVGLYSPDYPRTGPLAQRVAATRLLDRRLCDEVARLDDPTVVAVPIAEALAEPGTGALAAHHTDDGVHVNPLGAQVVRDQLAAAAG